MPVTISGFIRGIFVRLITALRVIFLLLTIPIEATKPRTVASKEETPAMIKVL